MLSRMRAEGLNVTERLQKCLDAGGVAELFLLLKDWPHEDLKHLIQDTSDFMVEEHARTAILTHEHLFKMENFFSDLRSSAILKAEAEARDNALAIMTEICSVATYYLPEAEWPAIDEES